jgi:hypothetical protein
MSNPLVLLPFLEEQNPKYTSFHRRGIIYGLTGQGAKTNFQVLASVSGKGYLDRAFLNAYWVFYNGHWLRFRIVVDGAVVYDHLVDATYQSSMGDASFGIGHMRYAESEWSGGLGQEWFLHPIYTDGGSTSFSKARMRNPGTLTVGIPPAITAVVGYTDSYGITAITEPIYFNTSLSIEVSMASGSSVGQGAIVISGGLN